MAYNAPVKIVDPMPHKHHEDDAQWINSKLNVCGDMRERLKVCDAYANAYVVAYDTETEEHKQRNAARKAANSRLLRYIAKKFKVFNR